MRHPIKIMISLIGLIKSLIPIMVLAIVLGILGHMSAILIPSLGFYAITQVILNTESFSMNGLLIILVLASFLRGVFRYGEQMSNHFIAFKVLAQLRHQIMLKLKSLVFTKLESKHKGELISTITSDVELLEVFYAHTISPIAIAVGVGTLLMLFYHRFHSYVLVTALVSYGLVGVGIPMINQKQSMKQGYELRKKISKIHSVYLDLVQGIKDVIQYSYQLNAQQRIESITHESEKISYKLRKQESLNRNLTDSVIIFGFITMLMVLGYLSIHGSLSALESVIIFGVFVSSFGPFIALSQLSNNLHLTLASGQRILDLMNEQTTLMEVDHGSDFELGLIEFKNVSFKYDQEWVLNDVSFSLEPKKLIGLYGESGLGKSTVTKLLNRFYDPDLGTITINQHNLKDINTDSLRENIAYMSSHTDIIHETIMENIRLANINASDDEVIEAAKRAFIHELIMSLPDQYQTIISSSHTHLSEGEKQRISLARCFVSTAQFWILDEPTSNVDSLNEAWIIKSLKENADDKTILIISHRQSTLAQCDSLFTINTK